MKNMDVLYLCDHHACQSKKYKSCEIDGMCRHTMKPEHAVNGYCARPDLEFDRFDEVSRFDSGGQTYVYYVERDDYVSGEVRE
jgi:hypothetical protein